MSVPFEIKGGASEFEAAVIAVVLDHLAVEEKARKSRLDGNGNQLSAWVKALKDQSGMAPGPPGKRIDF